MDFPSGYTHRITHVKTPFLSFWKHNETGVIVQLIGRYMCSKRDVVRLRGALISEHNPIFETLYLLDNFEICNV